MPGWIDLHLHTAYSDGTSSPEELLELVRSEDLCAISVTDHDTLAGYREVARIVTEEDPELVPGLELSARDDDSDLHILAYFIDPEDPALATALDSFQQRRNRRARYMVQKLNEMNIAISFDDVAGAAGEAAIGRPHVADTMVRGGFVRSYEEAFSKYIRNGGPAYVPKRNFTAGESIALVHQAGGAAVLAHPIIGNAWRFVDELVGLGLDGIEIYHPDHKRGDVGRLRRLAERYGLVVTGGSDFHGRDGRYGMVGSQQVPEEYLHKLRARASQIRGAS